MDDTQTIPSTFIFGIRPDRKMRVRGGEGGFRVSVEWRRHNVTMCHLNCLEKILRERGWQERLYSNHSIQFYFRHKLL